MDTSTTRSVKDIDTAIKAAERTIAKLESDKQKNIGLLTTARSTREQHALAALSNSDPKSQDKLTRARAAQLSLSLIHI